MKTFTLKTWMVVLGAMGLVLSFSMSALALSGGTTTLVTLLRVLADSDPPTPGVATAAGELYVEGDVEADGNLDIAGTATVTGAAALGAATVSGVITGGNAGTLSNQTNNSWIACENSECISFDYTSNAVAISTSTGVTSFTLPAAIAFVPTGGISTSVANGSNAACTTTCNTKTCITGFDAGASAFVACATATADTCLCGP